MVDTVLVVICFVTLVVWFVQEKYARVELQNNLDEVIKKGKHIVVDQLQSNTMPAWNDWLFKAVFLMWIVWA
ncbi:MAG: hypothetical protein ACI92E_002638, partial [Oceanicoccus sp.]